MKPAKQPPGRPRDNRVDQAIRDAVRELITETGYANLTVDAVAARASVGKAAIYRRFASRVELVFASLVHGRELTPLPDTGSLHGDLAALAGVVLAAFSDSAVAAAAPGLLADLEQHPHIADRFRHAFLDGERAEVSGILRRAAARGELATPGDPDLVHAAVLGTVFAWVFLLRQAPSPELVARIATLTTQGLTGACVQQGA